MKFTPKTEEELAQGDLLPPGTYDATVLSAEETKSKKGNDMIKLKLGVYRPSGGQDWVFDYLLEAMGHKLRHFAKSAGLNYEAGELTAEACEGRDVRVQLDIEPASAGYSAKNVVEDYVIPHAVTAAAVVEDDDEIPFK